MPRSAGSPLRSKEGDRRIRGDPQVPGVLDGNQLQAANTAATVRVNGGQTLVTEGAAVEAGTELNGYYIYDAPDLDAAVAFAARIPVARMGGTVEVRAMIER